MPTVIDGTNGISLEGTSSSVGQVKLYEDTDNGTNYVELKAPTSVASNVSFTLPSADGTSGQVLQTNGSGALSFTTLTSAGTFSATASGSLSDGSATIVNSNGTVSAVSGSAEVVFQSSSSESTSVAYDSTNGKIVIAYIDSSNNYGKAIVGTVSGTSITYGSSATFNAGTTYETSIAYDSVNQAFVISFRNSSNAGFAIIGTVSGTSISFGSPVSFDSPAYRPSNVYDVASGKMMIGYTAGSGDSSGYSIAGTVSGTSISFGGRALLLGGSNVTNVSCGYDPVAQKTIVGFCDVNTNRQAAAVVASLSGSTISYGTKAALSSVQSISANRFAYDTSASKFVWAIMASSNVYAATATISGTTITYGSPVNPASSQNNLSIAYDASLQKTLLSYENGSTGKFQLGTVSGTDVTFANETTFNPASSTGLSSVYSTTSTSIVLAYRDGGNSAYGTSLSIVGGSMTNLTTSNYIGISSGSYTNGQTATIQTVGSIDDAQSSLTAGQTYYVQANGTLATTAGTPSVVAGTAVSATKLIIKG